MLATISRKTFAILVAGLLVPQILAAQFYSQGGESLFRKWSQIKTDDWRLIYPSGCDSLAFVYADDLRAVSPKLAYSCDFLPNETFRRPMTVILHDRMPYNNGSVAWAPRRMDFYVTPDAFRPLAMTTDMELAVHEGRHSSQMQFTHFGPYKSISKLFGEMFSGAMSSVYCGPDFLEGDAVVAETALSSSGRGRSADFLEYYRACSAEGLTQNYWQWRYGSQKRFSPDHYTIGYIKIAGTRTVYNDPLFVNHYFSTIFENTRAIFPLLVYRRTVKADTGLTPKAAFNGIMASLDSTWKADIEARAPYGEESAVTACGKYYSSYEGTVAAPDGIYSVRKGIADTPRLVKINRDGSETELARVSALNSKLTYSPFCGNVFWSEFKPDWRWEYEGKSVIVSLHPDGKTEICKGLPDHCYNPAAHSGKPLLAITEYPSGKNGRTLVASFNDGKCTVNDAYEAPDGYQPVESVWMGDSLFTSAVTKDGMGIYTLPEYKPLMKPVFNKIHSLFQRDGRICFTSDLNGVNELYSLNPSSGEIERRSNSEQGGTDFAFAGDTLYYSSLRTSGRMIYATDTLFRKPFNTETDSYKWAMADVLSEQEKAGGAPLDSLRGGAYTVKPYSRIAHALKVHSWAPVYVNYDSIDDLSSFENYQDAGLGAMAIFQNDMGTLTGFAAYSHSKPDDRWLDMGHAKITYRGLPAVVEGEAHFFFEGGYLFDFRSYLPVNLSSRGWSRGLIPELEYIFNNRQSAWKASVRGYSMLPAPQSCIYPRLGIGAEAGVVSGKPFGLLYGYLPGFGKTHSVKLVTTANSVSSTGYVSAEYAMPCLPVEWSFLCPLLYIRNFELRPHLEYDFSLKGARGAGFAGVSVNAVSGNLLWVPFDTKIGVDFNWEINSSNGPLVSMVFSIDL